jgi:phosphoenolpyruvate synthase/pyruvate phosphate dikinase
LSKAVSIIPLSQIEKHTNSGAKARNLSVLQKMGHKIPETFVIPFEAFEEYLVDRKSGLQSISKLLEGILDESKKYSVRSSANAEDSSLISFAGQFETQLNCKGLNAVKDAIESTWISAQGEKANAYKSDLGHAGVHLKMAVIVQEMVEPEFSGVAFTKNPLTGLDEVIVETVDGYGDSLVQKGVTPERWVYKWGKWIEYPEEKEQRSQVILKIVETAVEIGNKVGAPINLEWAYDGYEIFWLQMREITTLSNTYIYSNRISREFLPGIILPLVWSVNIPVVNTSWKRLFIELIGGSAENIDINSLAKSFYYRAYFNMGVVGNIFQMLGMPREALEILAGIEAPEEGRPSFRPGPKTIRYLPRMILVAIRKLFFSKKIELFLRNRKKEYQKIAAMELASLNESATLEAIDTLFELNTDSSYYVILSQLLNSLYTTILRSRLEKRDIPFDKVEFKETDERLLHIDPKQQIAILHEEFQSLSLDEQSLLRTLPWKEALNAEELGSFRESLRSFIRRFGHLSDSGNDFSKPTWKESPDLILRMIVNQNPKVAGHSENAIQAEFEAALSESRMLRILYRRAAKYREYRESVNFLYTFGYSLFRRCFVRLGSLLNQKGILEQKNDVFYLTYDELKQLISDNSLTASLNRKIVERKAEIERFKDITLPEVIYNELPESALIKGKVLRDLRGVATSRGHYIGPARLVHGPSDFNKIHTGDVLVIPFSDVSWTPLFSKASAVVSESGGILSHCSIVAREYGIPAVVSVTGAMTLVDGTTLAVDGYSGKVQIME